MASGPTVEGGDGPRECKRYMEIKVYRRKSFKGLKKDTLTTPIPKNDESAATVEAATMESVSPETKTDEVSKDNGDARGENLARPPLMAVEDGDLPAKEVVPAVSGNTPVMDHLEGTEAVAPVRTPVSGDSLSPNKQKAAEAAPALSSRVDTVVVSDDSSSLNRQQGDVAVAPGPLSKDPPPGNGLVQRGLGDPVSVDPEELRARKEARELRRKLRGQLETVRTLVKKIEVKQVQVGGGYGSRSHVSANDAAAVSNGGVKRTHSEVGSFAGTPREVARPSNQLSVSVLENSHGVSETVEKEKRTPKANQFYRNSEFLLAKDKFPPAESNKKSKSNGKKHGGGDHGIVIGMGTKFAKSCSSLLEKLMKHKHGWVFNEPVDAERLGLHDYHLIIKQPMDLGTIKTRLSKNWYKSPKEFAEDVRVTFLNAMTYNPKGQDVHVMAEQLSTVFEERWAIIESDYNREIRFGMDYGMGYPTPNSRKVPPPLLPPPLDMRRVLDRSDSMTYSADPKRRPFSTVTPTARTPAPKKPKAKDPHKRDMTFDEKQKLSTQLQGLPSEKLDAIVQIIKKRNSSLFQHDDEIEVDIDSVDAETLWELDRFVTNYKKSLSKNKRKAELAMQARARSLQNVPEQSQAPIVQEAPRENKTDENIVSASSPVQGDKQGDTKSRSSSSSSSSSSGSSSSDSDSDSSSGSGSDDESPQRT